MSHHVFLEVLAAERAGMHMCLKAMECARTVFARHNMSAAYRSQETSRDVVLSLCRAASKLRVKKC